MPDTPGEGGKFTADIYALYEVARTDIQELADRYALLSRSVDDTRSDNIDPGPPTGTTSRGQSALQSGARLASLRDDLQYA